MGHVVGAILPQERGGTAIHVVGRWISLPTCLHLCLCKPCSFCLFSSVCVTLSSSEGVLSQNYKRLDQLSEMSSASPQACYRKFAEMTPTCIQPQLAKLAQIGLTSLEVPRCCFLLPVILNQMQLPLKQPPLQQDVVKVSFIAQASEQGITLHPSPSTKLHTRV